MFLKNKYILRVYDFIIFVKSIDSKRRKDNITLIILTKMRVIFVNDM